MNFKLLNSLFSIIFVTFGLFSQKNSESRIFSVVESNISVGYAIPTGRFSSTEQKTVLDPNNYFKYKGGAVGSGLTASLTNRFWYNKNKKIGIQLDLGITTLDNDVSERFFAGYSEGIINQNLAPKIIQNNRFWSSKRFMTGGVFNVPISLHGSQVKGHLNFQNSFVLGISNIQTPDFMDEITNNIQGTFFIRHHQKSKNLNAFCYEFSSGFNFSKPIDSPSGFTAFGLFFNYHNTRLKGKNSEMEITRYSLSNTMNNASNLYIPIDFDFSYTSIQLKLVYSF
jgi:hypothetical protein